MTKNESNKRFKGKSSRESGVENSDRREARRREHSDRREIERFGYKIMSRRSGDDRREEKGVD